MNTEQRKEWGSDMHEAKVENFYGSGIEGFHDYHEGYLSFGYWTRKGMSYVEAAENLVQTIGEVAGVNDQSQILDVGCGMGTQDVYLVKHFNPQSIDAVDVTWKHIERARVRAKKEGISEEQVRFSHGSAVKMPFKDDTFSHVISIEAPEHFDTREKFFYEAYRVMKPGGIFAIYDYALGRPPKNIIERTLVGLTAKFWQVPKVNVYGQEVFREKLSEAGFKNITIKDISDDVIPGYYYVHRKPESVREIIKIRGVLKGAVGGYIIDKLIFEAYRKGLCQYVLIRAEKK